MKWFLKELVSAGDAVSSTRVKSLIALIIAVICTFYGSDPEILIIWLTAAFVPQGLQKFAERRKRVDDNGKVRDFSQHGYSGEYNGNGGADYSPSHGDKRMEQTGL